MPFTDVVIVGSGLAALTAAWKLCAHRNVMIITKSKKEHSNSMLAQGGVAAAIDQSDSWNEHLSDTISAGCYHNNNEAVKLLVQYGPIEIHNFIDNGMEFDRDATGAFSLGQEGAHSRRRILHAGGDATGKEVTTFLFKQIKDKVKLIEDEMAIDLIMENGRCVGITTFSDDATVHTYRSNHVILATGGCGSLYQVSSNDSTVVGDGIAIAYRAGAQLADLEFIQFHPTMLVVDGNGRGLISEAVRGEGALLVSDSGRRIMEDIHPLQDLAPRDVVARTIQNEYNVGKNVYLDITMIPDFKDRFPTITSICENAGIQIEDGVLPVAPGAHFLMGGIKTNSNGQTSIPGLYAVGEVACTGVHGANRLASNSLLEGMVFADRVVKCIMSQKPRLHVPKTEYSQSFQTQVVLSTTKLPTKIEIQEMMTRYVGIERSAKGLEAAKQWMESFVNPETLGLRIPSTNKEVMLTLNMLTNCWLILTSALLRTESRGGHYRSDYPEPKQSWQNVQVNRTKEEQPFIKQESMVGVK